LSSQDSFPHLDNASSKSSPFLGTLRRRKVSRRSPASLPLSTGFIPEDYFHSSISYSELAWLTMSHDELVRGGPNNHHVRAHRRRNVYKITLASAATRPNKSEVNVFEKWPV
jgi:hypothetical protein